jgi:hypothetical protein
MSTTPTGLHPLAAPQRPEVMEEMTPELYGRLLSFLGRFYHVVLLDVGTGLTEPLARFALERADQTVVVNTSDWITSSTVLDALDYLLPRLGGHQLTMVINKAPRKAELRALESNLRGHRIPRHVTIPPGRTAAPDTRQRHLRLRAPATPRPHRRQATSAGGRRPARLTAIPQACRSPAARAPNGQG